MPQRKEQFISGEIYHNNIRAIDDNLIFKNTDDYYRGIFSIYEFNNANPVEIWRRRRDRAIEKKREKEEFNLGGHRKSPEVTSDLLIPDKRDRFVDILAFCFMPNHIHLLLKQIKDGGISKFMQKVGIGYGKYFNGKYKRKGHIFQDAFKSVHIKDDNQFKVVVPYIFTNPTALIEPGWKEKGIREHSTKEVIKFLEEYRWSSYQDCIGVKNFPSVTHRDFLLEAMSGKNSLKDAVKNWIEYKRNTAQSVNLFLE